MWVMSGSKMIYSNLTELLWHGNQYGSEGLRPDLGCIRWLTTVRRLSSYTSTSSLFGYMVGCQFGGKHFVKICLHWEPA